MEELILKMHEEAMELKRDVAELSALIDAVERLMEAKEVEIAKRTWSKRQDVLEATVTNEDIKRALGYKYRRSICTEAEAILKEREDAERNRSSEDDEGSSAE